MTALQNVLDDFVCALQKKILLQGRIYVFEHYVCFHANVFGYIKKVVIPLRVRAALLVACPIFRCIRTLPPVREFSSSRTA